MSANIEEHNLKQINRLNQRGGHMLSIIDLLEADTVNKELAGFLFYSMSLNLSFLTAANPSGTGKTTLMGAMLNLLKPGIEIQTLSGRESTFKPAGNTCYLVHEIGSGPYFSYLWGSEAAEFLRLAKDAALASCMHADTLSEMKNILFNPPLNISQEDFSEVNLILFMAKEGGFLNARRRVVDVYGYMPSREQHLLLYQWQRDTDRIKAVNVSDYRKWLAGIKGIEERQVKKKIGQCAQFLEDLQEREINRLPQVRAEAVNFYTENLS